MIEASQDTQKQCFLSNPFIRPSDGDLVNPTGSKKGA